PSVRGRWGEIQLKRAVEIAGMVEHCDFDSQKTIEGEDGRLRPDMVVHLPDGKVAVLDAQAPLSGYLEAIDAEDDTLRTQHLRDHARQVRQHLVKLGAKAYWQQFNATPDFVVLFLPCEPVL